MKKKTLALLLSLVLVIGVAAGGTLAWLLDSTTPVVNTFTDSDINITLTEAEGSNNDYSFKMIPGWTIAKDPKVTVEADSEACFLFVKIDKSENYDTYLKDYTVADGWTQLPDANEEDAVSTDGVYYREVTDITADQSFYVLKGATHKTDCEQGEDCACPNLNGYVTVKDTVTKKQMNDLQAEGATYPTLTFTAYATQKWQSNSTAFTPYEAWTKVAPVAPTPAPTPSGP